MNTPPNVFGCFSKFDQSSALSPMEKVKKLFVFFKMVCIWPTAKAQCKGVLRQNIIFNVIKHSRKMQFQALFLFWYQVFAYICRLKLLESCVAKQESLCAFIADQEVILAAQNGMNSDPNVLRGQLNDLQVMYLLI